MIKFETVRSAFALPVRHVAVAALLVALAPIGVSRAASTDADPAADTPTGTGSAAAGGIVEPAAEGDGALDAVPASATECAAADDFPTTAVADYVLGCMAANGNTHEALQQCSCSIDFIKSRMDYKSYEQAGTVLQVQRDIGQRGIFYRDSNWAKSRVERLEALQAESTLRCF